MRSWMVSQALLLVFNGLTLGYRHWETEIDREKGYSNLMGPCWGSGSRTANLSKKEGSKRTNPHLRNISLCYWRMYSASLTTGTHAQHGADGARQSKIRSPGAKSLNKSHTHWYIRHHAIPFALTLLGSGPAYWCQPNDFHISSRMLFFVLVLLCFWLWRQIELQRPKREV